MLDLKAIVESVTVPVDEDIIRMAEEIETIKKHRTSREQYVFTLGKALAGSLPVIDVAWALRMAGCDPDIRKLWPRLAFGRASRDKCSARLTDNGAVNFDDLMTIPDMVPFPRLIRYFLGGREWSADVPLVPVKIRPANLTHFSILWEPDWERVKLPKLADPYLLKFVTGTFYQIIASWDVTELEIKVMRLARI